MNIPKQANPPIFSASLMCMNMLDMREQFRILNDRIQMYHVDIMDGHFCKNITLSPDFVKVCASVAEHPIDVHLMVEHPGDFIDQLIRVGANIISPHAETINVDAFRTIDRIKSAGCQMGVVLNPSTPLSYVSHYLNHIDLLTIMTVDVGYSGGKFVPEMLDKIREAARIREERGLHYTIQVDGACNAANFKAMDEAGAEAYVVGNTGLFAMDPDLNRAADILYADFSRETGKAL
mgnify:FL=1